MPSAEMPYTMEASNLPHATNIIVSKLDGAVDVIFFRMIQNRFCTLDVAGRRFYFHERTLAFVADYKIYFQAGILVEIIELPSHLCENIGNQVFKDGTFVAEKITLQMSYCVPSSSILTNRPISRIYTLKVSSSALPSSGSSVMERL